MKSKIELSLILFLIIIIGILIAGYIIGGIVKKRKLIGDSSEDTLLFRHELAGEGVWNRFRSITPDNEEIVYGNCKQES